MLIIRKTIELHTDELDDDVIEEIIGVVDEIDFEEIIRERIQAFGTGFRDDQLRVTVEGL